MEKSRLGISIGLFGALIYFIGAAGGNLFIIALATGYIVFFEPSEWLKKTAVKALIITIVMLITAHLLIYAMNFVANLLNGFQNISTIINNSYSNYALSNLFSSVQSGFTVLIHAAQILIHVALGFKTYKQQDIKIKVIDNILDKHL